MHTNGIEGVWSLFKRPIGSYHQVSAKQMDRYLEEFEWRFSQRANPFLFGDALTLLVNADPGSIRNSLRSPLRIFDLRCARIHLALMRHD